MINDKKQDIVLDYLEEIDQPFTLIDLFKTTGLKKTRKNEIEIDEMIHATDYFVKDKKTYYPKHTFLTDIPLRIQPTEFEIDKGILIPGHRMLPFHPFGRFMDEITFLHNNLPIKTKTMAFTMLEIQIYFSLMDLEKIPISNIEDILEEDAKLKIKVCDMRSFYKNNNFKSGDSIIVKSLDFKEGLFSIEYDSYDNYHHHFFEIEKIDRKFRRTLKQVLEEELIFPNIEKQLLNTYFYLKDETWTVPGSAVGPLLTKDQDITFSPLPGGRTLFHFADQEIEALDVFPDFDDYLEEEDEEFELDTIDGVLKYLNNNNNRVVVRALLLDQITNQSRFSYKKVEDYLFANLEKPYMPLELRKFFKNLVNEDYLELKNAFNPANAFLPITTARQKTLEASLLISKFLRSLDAQRVQLEDLPKSDMMHLMELDRALSEVLYNLEVSQLEEENNIAGVHRILKMVDRVTTDLPRVFDLIRAKIK